MALLLLLHLLPESLLELLLAQLPLARGLELRGQRGSGGREHRPKNTVMVDRVNNSRVHSVWPKSILLLSEETQQEYKIDKKRQWICLGGQHEAALQV